MCGLGFSFGGLTGGFNAFAFVNFDSASIFDGISADSAPIIPYGTLLPQDPCTPVDPCREQGLIVAYDDPETVGTFDISIIRAVPEPGTLGLFGAGVVFAFGRRLRPRRFRDA